MASALVSIQPPDYEIAVSIDERQLGQVSPGQNVSVLVDVYAGESFTGTVRTISPSVDGRTRAVAARVSPAGLAADIGRYGAGAQWKGVYYKGDKIGFMVGETIPLSDGYELREEGQLLMTLFGSTTAARRIRPSRCSIRMAYATSLKQQYPSPKSTWA